MKITPLVSAFAVAVLALPAAAGSWPNLPARVAAGPASVKPAVPASASAAATTESRFSLSQSRYFRSEEGHETTAEAPVVALPATPPGYAAHYVAGEVGWEPASHKFVRANGRWAMAPDCPHRLRAAS